MLTMWLQVDGKHNTYILNAPYRMKKALFGWKWLKGYKGCFVTNDETLAVSFASLNNLVIRPQRLNLQQSDCNLAN